MTDEQIKQQRDEAMDVLSQISFEFGFGLGDETTSAQEYYKRIKEGFKFLTDPIIDLKNKYKEERDEAIEGLLKSEEKVVMKLDHYDCIISKLDNARKEADFYKAKYEALLEETQNEH